MIKVQLSGLGEAALRYARQGWPVFPCAPGMKIPAVSQGVYAATLDEDLITEWWSRDPYYNIGFPTGEIYVIDSDGSTGADSITMIAAGFEWPETRMVQTPHGTHYYFRAHEELPNSASKLGDKIDSRGYGGYVCLPPSINYETGAIYTWANDLPIADLPEWAAVELRPKRWTPEYVPPPENNADEFVLYEPKKYDTKTGSWTLGDQGPLHPYLHYLPGKFDALSRLVEGSRNQTYNELAFLCGRIAHAGLGDPVYMEENLKSAARASGLDAREIEQTWRSGYESGWAATPFGLKEDPWAPTGTNVVQFRKTQTAKSLSNEYKLKVTAWEDIKKKDMEFIWGDRLVKNGVNLIGGDGGIGKSAVALAIAASVTDGIPLPDSKGQTLRGHVALVSYEDPEHLIHMRGSIIGITHGLFVIEGAQKLTDEETDEEMVIQFCQEQIPLLDGFLHHHPNVRLLIVDPWARYLDGDDGKDAYIRRAIAPLEDLIRRHDITVILVCHTNKNSAYTEAIARIAGHSALKNLARSVLMLNTVEGETKAIAHGKHNWSKRADTVLYAWQDNKSWTDGENPLAWGDTTKMDADELFAAKKTLKIDEARAWFRRMLSNGPVGLADIQELAREEGFKEKTLQQAKLELGIVEERVSDSTVPGISRLMLRLPYDI